MREYSSAASEFRGAVAACCMFKRKGVQDRSLATAVARSSVQK